MSPPLRIASLLASGTEILYGLGLGEQVVAVSHECDFPSDLHTKPRVTRARIDPAVASGAIDQQVKEAVTAGAALYDIDVPLLAELQPDLIVTQAQCDVCAVRYADVLQAIANQPSLAAARVVALNPLSFADVFADIRRVGEACGRPLRAAAFCAALEARVDLVRRRAGQVREGERPRVVGIEWVDPLMAAGNWFPDMVEIAGGINCVSRPGQHSPYVEWQAIVAADPQVLIVMPCGFDLDRSWQEAQSLWPLPGWDAVAAVRDGRVHAVDGNAYFNRSGPRMVDSLEILSRLLHPQVFDEPQSFARAARRVTAGDGFQRISLHD